MRLLNSNQLREKLGGRGRTTIYRDIEAGRLPRPILLGGRNYWIEDEVDKAMQNLAHGDSTSQ